MLPAAKVQSIQCLQKVHPVIGSQSMLMTATMSAGPANKHSDLPPRDSELRTRAQHALPVSNHHRVSNDCFRHCHCIKGETLNIFSTDLIQL